MKQDYTVREIAETLNVSKPTVQRCINKNSIKPTRIVKNKTAHYDLTAIEIIIKEVKNGESDLANLFATPPQESPSGETPRFIPPYDAPSGATPPQESPSGETEKNSEAIDILLAMLQEEIKKKDLELAKKDERIESLENKLQEAHLEILNFGKNAQFIAAANETNKYLERKEENNSTEDKVNKKGLLSRIFGKM